MSRNDPAPCAACGYRGVCPYRVAGGVAAAMLVAVLAAPLLGTASSLRAQGFGIYEQGACVMGRGGAAAARPCGDGSAIFFNPAGLAGVEGPVASLGATGIAARGNFTSDRRRKETDLQNGVIPVPHGYAARRVVEDVTAGIGVYVPYGLETEWPEGRESSFAGRFLGYENSLRSLYVQPTGALRVTDRLSVGGGPLLAVSTVELNRRLDLSRRRVPGRDATFGQLGIPSQTAFADAGLDADPSVGFGANVGVRWEATDRISVGARYLTPVEIDYDGRATFEQVSTGLVLPAENPFGAPAGTSLDQLLRQADVFSQSSPVGPLADQGVSTSITMPGQLVVGGSFRATPDLRVEADWVYTQWAAFDTVRLDFELPGTPDEVMIENYDDTHGVHAGVEYRFAEDLDLRAGYFWNEPAAPDDVVTPLLPEGERAQGAAGVGWQATERLELNVAYQFLHQFDRRGRTVDPPPGEAPEEALNNGVYSFDAHLLAATATVRW